MKATLHKHATFQYVSATNKSRTMVWLKGDLDIWTPADWAMATAGEFGELCNALKKIKRLDEDMERTDRGSREELMKKVAQEIGDTYVYLDLLCQRMGLDMYTCIADTFNRVSEREGLPHRLI